MAGNIKEITGQAAGVPFVAVPPDGGVAPNAPVVVAWHLMDPPRTEAAFAAAVPLAGLDAWRVYLGLPLTGARMPEGGAEEIMRLGYEDAVLNLFGPVIEQAVAEFGPAFADLRRQLGFGNGPLGLMGGSAGAAVAQAVLAGGEADVRAAVLLSPLVQLRRVVEAIARQMGFPYAWSGAADAVADRLDFVARAAELKDRAAVLLVVGDQDDPGILEPAAALRAALDARLETVPGMGHTLAEEPGVEPAPQTAHAATADRLAVEWFRRHLVRQA